jgi:hypothetical protein
MLDHPKAGITEYYKEACGLGKLNANSLSPEKHLPSDLQNKSDQEFTEDEILILAHFQPQVRKQFTKVYRSEGNIQTRHVHILESVLDSASRPPARILHSCNPNLVGQYITRKVQDGSIRLNEPPSGQTETKSAVKTSLKKQSTPTQIRSSSPKEPSPAPAMTIQKWSKKSVTSENGKHSDPDRDRMKTSVVNSVAFANHRQHSALNRLLSLPSNPFI